VEVPGLSVEIFLAQLAAVPWFSNIGRPTPSDAGVKRIFAWEEWPGPEKDPAITELHLRHQALFDAVMRENFRSGHLLLAVSCIWATVPTCERRRGSR